MTDNINIVVCDYGRLPHQMHPMCVNPCSPYSDVPEEDVPMTAQDYQYEILLDRMARMIFERETMSKGLWTDVQRRYYRALAAELLVLIEAHNDPKVEVSVKDLRGLLAESEVMATNLRSTGALTVPDYLYEIHRRLWKVLDEVDGK